MAAKKNIKTKIVIDKTPPKFSAKKSKSKYLICKASVKTQARLAKAAELAKRPVSNLVCIIVENWLDDNEVEA